MSHVFAYCRVSALEQSSENQCREIEMAGFSISTQRLIEENISSSIAAAERPGFIRLLDQMKKGDVLVVTKLDCLGHNVMDIRKTIELLSDSGIGIYCLALGGVDLTSPAGKATLQVISAVAVFEHDLLLERIHADTAGAKVSGKRVDRPHVLDNEQKEAVVKLLKEGNTISTIAREFNTTRQIILRVKVAMQNGNSEF